MKKLYLLSLQTAVCWKCFHPAYVILALKASFLHLHVSCIATLYGLQLANLSAGYFRYCHFIQLHQTVCFLLIPYLLPA